MTSSDSDESRVIRAADRFRSRQDGIESWHCFSAGAHYDPANTSFELLIGVDEHLISPRAGFDWHAHRGVDIVSWVQSGVLHHQSADGDERDVAAGEVLVQRAAAGIRHRETNAGDAPLRLVQMTLLAPDGAAGGPSVNHGRLPLRLGAATFDVWADDHSADARAWHAFVAGGTWLIDQGDGEYGDGEHGDGEHGDGVIEVAPGDSVRGHHGVAARGTGRLLVWSFT